MRKALLTTLLLMSGCLCGGYDGGGNKVYQRSGAELLILCENGGFVANLTSSTIEGRYMEQTPDVGIGVDGATGDLAFDFTDHHDGTASTPQLGDTPWTQMNLDQVALDHANVQCTDLEAREWWTAQ